MVKETLLKARRKLLPILLENENAVPTTKCSKKARRPSLLYLQKLTRARLDTFVFGKEGAAHWPSQDHFLDCPVCTTPLTISTEHHPLNPPDNPRREVGLSFYGEGK